MAGMRAAMHAASAVGSLTVAAGIQGPNVGSSQWLDPKLSKSGIARKAAAPGQKPAAVDPELAALVVREYLLPMFEGKKSLLAMNKSSQSGDDKDEVDDADAGGLMSLVKHGAPKEGIYGEMKLSDQLLDTVQMLKGECADLRQRLTSSESDRTRLEGKLNTLKGQNEETKVELKMVRFQEENLRARAQELETECCLLERQQLQLEAELRKQQTENTSLSRRLFEEEAKVEQLSRTVAQNQNTASLSKLENDVLAEQVRNLHGAVHTLSDAKTLSDQLAFTNSAHETKLKQVYEYKEKIEMELARVHDERNALLNTKRELTGLNEDLEAQIKTLQQEFDDAKQKNRQDLLELFEEKETIRKERDKLEKKVKDLSEDRDKFKQRLKKYRARRKMFEQEQKTCKKCGKEYLESENFNWSCRTHLSEFGGEMWWCCGKLGKDAIGCKFAKHESKDDDDDMDEQEKMEKAENDKKLKNLNIRCYSCKEIGHKAKDCPRDPNPRTKYMSVKENRRIDNLQHSSAKAGRVVNSDDMVQFINDKLGFNTLGSGGDLAAAPFDDVIQICLETVQARKREERQKKLAMGLPVSDSEEEEESEDEESDDSDDDEDEDGDYEDPDDEDEARASLCQPVAEDAQATPLPEPESKTEDEEQSTVVGDNQSVAESSITQSTVA